jgi:hypothetical protein
MELLRTNTLVTTDLWLLDTDRHNERIGQDEGRREV